MEVKLNVTVTLAPETKTVLMDFAKSLAPLASAKPVESAEEIIEQPEKAPKVKAKKAKPAPAPVEEELSEAEEAFMSEDFGEEANDDIEGIEELEEETDAVLDEKQLTQLKKALNTYATKKNRVEAIKVLNKFAKTSAEVKAADFAKIMKALK